MATSATVLKYEANVDVICKAGFQCPPPSASEMDVTAYRWVANPISKDCFKPVAVRNPTRLLSATDSEKKCSCWGLSMHTSLKASVAAFLAVEKSFKKARKTFGDHVAKGYIKPAHGKCTVPDNFNHFDFHEYKIAPVSAAFGIDSVIPSKP